MIELRGFPTADGPLDLDAAAGEVILLKGPNGSGKSSLLRALAGLTSPIAPREATVLGAPVGSLAARDVALRCTLSPQHATGALAGLTVAGEFGLRGRAPPAELSSFSRRESTSLSSGEARRVVLALARSGPAPVLLLDEPAEGLDAAGRARLRALVQEASRRGAVVAVDHGGALDGLATRTVRLAPEPATRDVALPEPGGPIAFERARAVVRRGERPIPLPALRLPAGFHALVGGNGSGKTTLLLHHAGLLGGAPRPDVRLALADARAHLTRETVDEELARCEERIAGALVPEPLRERHPLTLSGGEAQRVSLAKALGVRAGVYLLDEPDAYLDAEGRAALLDVLSWRIQEGACVLAATHDEGLVKLARTRIEMEAAA